GVLPARQGPRRGDRAEPPRVNHRPLQGQAHRPARDQRAEPARAADRAEVLRAGAWRGVGERRPWPPRGVSAREHHALTRPGAGALTSAAKPSPQLAYLGSQPSSSLALAFEDP